MKPQVCYLPSLNKAITNLHKNALRKAGGVYDDVDNSFIKMSLFVIVYNKSEKGYHITPYPDKPDVLRPIYITKEGVPRLSIFPITPIVAIPIRVEGRSNYIGRQYRSVVPLHFDKRYQLSSVFTL